MMAGEETIGMVRTGRRQWLFALLALLAALLLVYSNSFTTSWHFDDFDNIVNNSHVHMKSFSWHEVQKSFRHVAMSRIGRPLAYFSFALNYYVGGLDVFGYHVVNFAIHYCTAVLLFCFLLGILTLPVLRGRYEENRYAVALLATFFWALSPLQVTAVTYIVQRMASLCTLFYLGAMYCYLLGRTEGRRARAYGFYGLCALSGMLSLASKQNGVTLPIALFLLDLFLIQGATRENTVRSLKYAIIPMLAILGAAIFFFGPSLLLGDYSVRPFTLGQRLLTQPRVILSYVSLLLYPVTSRLMLVHDVDPSTGLLEPWTTLPAMALLFGGVLFAVIRAERYPLLAFSILFFLLNHAVEGSFTALELMFEHRNYLPSMLFFLPLAILLVRALEVFPQAGVLRPAVGGVIALALFSSGHTTYYRNLIFHNEYTLWMDNMKKAPNVAIPYGALGRHLYEEGLPEMALPLIEKALSNRKVGNLLEYAVYRTNKGWILFSMGRVEDGSREFQEALRILPGAGEPLVGMALVMLRMGDTGAALLYAEEATRKRPDFVPGLNALSLVLLKRGDADRAIETATHSLSLSDPSRVQPLSVLGAASMLKGDLRAAAIHWERYRASKPRDTLSLLALVEIYDRLGERTKRDRIIAEITAHPGYRGLEPLLAIAEERSPLLSYVPDGKVLEGAFRNYLKR